MLPLIHEKAAFVSNSINLAAILQNVDRRSDDVRHMQPAPASAYRLAAFGLKLRSHIGFQHSADSLDLSHLVYEFLPESAAVCFFVAQFSQRYARAAALQGR